MMNFIETATTTASPRTVNAVEPTVQQTPAKTICKKAFGVSFLLTVVTFSFTLTGLITAGNWVTDHVVIPRLLTAQIDELRQPTSNFNAPDADAAVETTSAR